MKDKKHIMIDIETLSVKDNATIFQIAMASFDITTGKVISEIDLKLDIEKTENLLVDGNTLKWWLNINKELLTQLLNEGTWDEQSMYQKLTQWINEQGTPEELTLWGNGIIFDNAKLKSKYEQLDIVYPFRYNSDRDVRTILALAEDKTGHTSREIKDSVKVEGEVAHDALDDVNYQIRLVHKCYTELMN